MSSDRRFEYDKGPDLADEEPVAEGDDGDDDENDPAGGATQRGRTRFAVPPWKAGAVSGVSAFAVVLAATYQLVGAMFGGGMFGGVEAQPSRWVVTGLVTLGSHGATIKQGEETIRGGFGFVRGLTSHVSALVPIVVLVVAGYLLVRYVRLETRRDGGLALGSLVLCYVVPTAALAGIARWTLETDTNGAQEAETIAVAMDSSLFVAIGGTALTFVVVGAGIAAVPRLLAVTE
ncbi:hypothetical protein [Natrinema salaciae]|uniref:Uncharacterized protein n=1 Tax=Natrinema salaciae TaxID=1186196 RepID=A0A1H9IIT9_9EURY|nr:hypothetical protein [Natrinema salaciae]SEQ74476.1 hypothetical protein SAMN04489841_2245 [Natrinema salaciae]